MSTLNLPIGVAYVSTQQSTSNVITGLNAVTVTSASQSLTSINKNSRRKLLSGSYKVAVALLGEDKTNGGYTVTQSSVFTASPISISSGNGIAISIPNGSFSANMNEAIAAAIFLQKGSANPFLASYAFINSAADFTYLLPFEQLNGAPQFATGTITGSGSDPTLGPRTATGVTYLSTSPTSRGVDFVHQGTKVPISLDTTVDFNLITARAVDVRTAIARGDLQTVMQSIGGDWWQYVYTDGSSVTHNVEIGDAQAYSIAPTSKGNAALLCTEPANPDGTFVTRLLIGNTITNIDDLTESFKKDANKTLEVTFGHAAYDTLVQGVGTGIYYRQDF